MKLAMIGSYGHVGMVLNSLKNLPEVELVAAAKWGDDDPMGYIGHHPATPSTLSVYDDYRQMIENVRPDIVGVFMPLYRNAEAATFAVDHLCHVFCEKPLATTLEDLNALKWATERSNVRVAAMMGMRCESAFQSVRNAVSEGRIGKVVMAFGQKSYPFGQRDHYYKSRETYGGSILWQAIHAVDFVSWCTGKGYTKVSAMQSNAGHPTHPGMEDNGGLLLQLDNGGHAVITFDYFRPYDKYVRRRWGDDRLRIVGSEAIVEIIDEGTRVLLTTPMSTEDLPLPPQRDMFAEFYRSAIGQGECIITPEESFRLMEVCLKARDAADQNKVIDL